MNTTTTGDIAEACFLTAVVNLGGAVLLPFGTHRYDLVIDWHGNLLRVNVKTARREGGCLGFGGASFTSAGRTLYDASQIDYFGVHDRPSSQNYLVPVAEAGISLRLEPTKK